MPFLVPNVIPVIPVDHDCCELLCKSRKRLFRFSCLRICVHSIKGNGSGVVFYDLQYRSEKQVVSVSYENIEDHLLVIVYQLVKQQFPDYDDKQHTLHLHVLNHAVNAIVGQANWEENWLHFRGLKAEGTVERRLLKSAKELRLCLTHFNELKKF